MNLEIENKCLSATNTHNSLPDCSLSDMHKGTGLHSIRIIFHSHLWPTEPNMEVHWFILPWHIRSKQLINMIPLHFFFTKKKMSTSWNKHGKTVEEKKPKQTCTNRSNKRIHANGIHWASPMLYHTKAPIKMSKNVIKDSFCANFLSFCVWRRTKVSLRFFGKLTSKSS